MNSTEQTPDTVAAEVFARIGSALRITEGERELIIAGLALAVSHGVGIGIARAADAMQLQKD